VYLCIITLLIVGPVPVKAELLVDNKAVLHVISKETDQLVSIYMVYYITN